MLSRVLLVVSVCFSLSCQSEELSDDLVIDFYKTNKHVLNLLSDKSKNVARRTYFRWVVDTCLYTEDSISEKEICPEGFIAEAVATLSSLGVYTGSFGAGVFRIRIGAKEEGLRWVEYSIHRGVEGLGSVEQCRESFSSGACTISLGDGWYVMRIGGVFLK